MIKIVFIFLVIFYVGFFVTTLYAIFYKSKPYYAIIFFIAYLPAYTTFQSIALSATGSPSVLIFWQVLKELLLLITLSFVIATSGRPLFSPITITSTDKLYGTFIFLATVFLVLPVGGVPILNKLLYYRTILLPAGMYYLGRNMFLTKKEELHVAYAIFYLLLITFTINFLEFASGTHFHSVMGWDKYNWEILENAPKGHYGLGWNFENGPNQPRFAAMYSNSLEAGNSAILTFACAAFLFCYTPYRKNSIIFGLGASMAFFSNYLAFSRAALVALVLSIFGIAYLLKYYRLLILSGFGVFLVALFVMFLAGDNVRNYVVDTITFRQVSSLGHLYEWIQGIQSMLNNPLGIGLGTSGSAKLVEEGDRVGGENQYIVYGVQMGVLGLLLYISLMLSAIWESFQAFRLSKSANDRMIPFLATITRFGLLLPLFTTLADGFLFVTMVSWWMVGYSVTKKNQFKRA